MSVRGASSIKAGIDVLPAVCLMVPGSIVVSIMTTRLGHFRWAIWGGWAITILACGLQLLFDIHSKSAITLVVFPIFGIGMGMVLTSLNVGVQAISSPEDSAMAASMYGFLRSLGMPLGVAVSVAYLHPPLVKILTLVAGRNGLLQRDVGQAFEFRTANNDCPRLRALHFRPAGHGRLAAKDCYTGVVHDGLPYGVHHDDSHLRKCVGCEFRYQEVQYGQNPACAILREANCSWSLRGGPDGNDVFVTELIRAEPGDVIIQRPNG
jgi:hypothetical protein